MLVKAACIFKKNNCGVEKVVYIKYSQESRLNSKNVHHQATDEKLFYSKMKSQWLYYCLGFYRNIFIWSIYPRNTPAQWDSTTAYIDYEKLLHAENCDNSSECRYIIEDYVLRLFLYLVLLIPT